MTKALFKYRGDVERWNARLRMYAWIPGYSEDGESGGVLYPWMTYTECLADAKARGLKASFPEEQDA